MTNRELLQKAMPLTSLSKAEWNLFQKHLSEVKDSSLLNLLEKLQSNQSRIEIISNYLDYYADTLNESVCSESITTIQIGF